MSVGTRLKKERARLELAQKEMAGRCGVSPRAQRMFEADQNIPGGAYLIAAHALGVDVVYVLTGRQLSGARRAEADFILSNEFVRMATGQLPLPEAASALKALAFEEGNLVARSDRLAGIARGLQSLSDEQFDAAVELLSSYFQDAMKEASGPGRTAEPEHS